MTAGCGSTPVTGTVVVWVVRERSLHASNTTMVASVVVVVVVVVVKVVVFHSSDVKAHAGVVVVSHGSVEAQVTVVHTAEVLSCGGAYVPRVVLVVCWTVVHIGCVVCGRCVV